MDFEKKWIFPPPPPWIAQNFREREFFQIPSALMKYRFPAIFRKLVMKLSVTSKPSRWLKARASQFWFPNQGIQLKEIKSVEVKNSNRIQKNQIQKIRKKSNPKSQEITRNQIQSHKKSQEIKSKRIAKESTGSFEESKEIEHLKKTTLEIQTNRWESKEIVLKWKSETHNPSYLFVWSMFISNGVLFFQNNFIFVVSQKMSGTMGKVEMGAPCIETKKNSRNLFASASRKE